MTTRIQLRRDTAANWTTNNPVLALGEMGIETDTRKFKFGNGVTAWSSLDYAEDEDVVKKEHVEGSTTVRHTVNAVTNGTIIHGIWGAYPGTIDGIEITGTNVVSDFIKLPETDGDTLVMHTPVLDLAGSDYGAIQLYNYLENSSTALIDYFKRDGSKDSFEDDASFELVCEADNSVVSPYYTFTVIDETTCELKYNPNQVKYMRCFVDPSAAQYSYTTEETVDKDGLDITDGIIKTETVTPVYHQVNILRGCMRSSKTYIYPATEPSIESGTKVSMEPLEGGSASSQPVRTFTEMVEIKDGGIIFDESLYDYNGTGYWTLTFYDANQTYITGYNGIVGEGLYTITDNKITIDESVSELTIDISSPTAVELRVPTTFKYVRAALTASPDYGVENGGLTARYHYLDETPIVTERITTLEEYIQSNGASIEKDTSYSWSRNYGKTVGVLGGSFATTTYAKTAINFWKEKLNLTINDYAVGGAGFTVGTTFNTQASSATVADIYVIWCSTNDFTKGGTIGTSADAAGTNTQWGAFKEVLATLYSKNPNAKICLFTSSPHLTQAKGNEEGIGTEGSQEYTLRQFVEAQVDMCKMYSIPCLDQYFSAGQNSFNKSLVCRSGDFHLTAFGYSMLYPKQAEFLANL